MGCRERIYKYVAAFLGNRTATIGLGELRTEPFPLVNIRTPQGPIISPLVFNITMIKIAKQLRALPDVGHVIYADDITLWANSGTTPEKARNLQNVVN